MTISNILEVEDLQIFFSIIQSNAYVTWRVYEPSDVKCPYTITY